MPNPIHIYPRASGALGRAREALQREEQARLRAQSVMSKPMGERWQPEYEKEPPLEPPMISPDDIIGTGIPTKLAMMLKGALPVMGGLGVIKNKGGNWLSGSVEGALGGLKKAEPVRPPVAQVNIDQASRDSALNRFIDKKLTGYVKNQMATPEDPVRALAEQGILHMPLEAGPPGTSSTLVSRRAAVGQKPFGEGVSPLARNWEEIADNSVGMPRLMDLSNAQMTDNPWLRSLSDEARKEVKLFAPSSYRENFDNLGFNHLTDELSNSLNAQSGLPAHLQLKPQDLDKMGMDQVVRHVAKVNDWRAAQKMEADAMRANNAATSVFKEYPDNNPRGLRWVELRSPEEPLDITKMAPEEAMARMKQRDQSLRDALKYEGDTMGHCVGGYCDDVASGRSRIMSLRDAKGQPHVTVEVKPGLKYDKTTDDPDMDDMDLIRHIADKLPAHSQDKYTKWVEENYDTYDSMREALENSPYAKYLPISQEVPASIVQIKGKQNKAPNPEYLPFVQDFVKSGQWSDVGDLRNTGLIDVSGRKGAVEALGKRYVTEQELDQWLDSFPDSLATPKPEGFAHGGSVNQNNPLTSTQLAAIIQRLRQEHPHA